MEDHRIVSLLLARDPAGLQAAEEKYRSLLLRQAGQIVYDSRDAEECVNDALLQLWSAVPPQKPASLGAFLRVLVRRNALDRRRRQTAGKRGGTEFELSLEELADCVSGSESESAGELTAAVEQWLGTVSAEMRAAFLRRYFAAETVREIAQALRCSEAKVKSMLFRARKGLRDYLKQEGFDP